MFELNGFILIFGACYLNSKQQILDPNSAGIIWQVEILEVLAYLGLILLRAVEIREDCFELLRLFDRGDLASNIKAVNQA